MKNPTVYSLSTSVGRREFMKHTGLMLGAVSLSGVLAEILVGCSHSTETDQSGKGNTKPVTSSTTINISGLTSNGQFMVSDNAHPDGMPILVIRQDASTYTALSMLCTHDVCQVDTPSNNSITCPCHGSKFDLHGNVLEGPATSPLRNYAVTLNASAQTITVTY